MSDTAADAAHALLVAMETEEPFRLLRTLPEKLERLWVTERQDASAEVCDPIPPVFLPS